MFEAIFSAIAASAAMASSAAASGIHPIGGVGVPHDGCDCRNCSDARTTIDGECVEVMPAKLITGGE